jgi:hypothetical protein
MNNRADVDNGGSDHCEKVVVENNPGKEKPRPNQSTILLCIEGSWYTSIVFYSVCSLLKI